MARTKSSSAPPKRGRFEKTELTLTEIQGLLSEMQQAVEKDTESFEAGTPALAKVKLLPRVLDMAQRSEAHGDLIDNGFLTQCAGWLAPLPDGTLSSLKVRTEILRMLLSFENVSSDTLENSNIGAFVAYLGDHPDETADNKDICSKLKDQWTHSMFQEDEDDFEEEHQPTRPTVSELTTQQMPSGSRKSYFARPPPAMAGLVAPPRSGGSKVVARKRSALKLKRAKR
ncbi:hypothetical protein P9112_010523 [Eukaryota sp. TZLM1-RC]